MEQVAGREERGEGGRDGTGRIISQDRPSKKVTQLKYIVVCDTKKKH